MEDFNSETDSDYTSYWRDWVGLTFTITHPHVPCRYDHVVRTFRENFS